LYREWGEGGIEGRVEIILQIFKGREKEGFFPADKISPIFTPFRVLKNSRYLKSSPANENRRTRKLSCLCYRTKCSTKTAYYNISRTRVRRREKQGEER
jgi:hypothetical protein